MPSQAPLEIAEHDEAGNHVATYVQQQPQAGAAAAAAASWARVDIVVRTSLLLTES